MKTGNRPLVALRMRTLNDYEENLEYLIEQIQSTPSNAVVVAPEVCLTLFDYEHFEAAAAFTPKALCALQEATTQNRIVVLTMIERRDDGIYNVAKVLHNGQVVHEQAKSKLFRLGDEHHYFSEGSDKAVVTFEADGLRMGVLICFELRFSALWQQLRGADLIVIPAQWGSIRAEHFESLTQALAIMNQCYVVASDGDNEEMTRLVRIVSPFGKTRRATKGLMLQGQFETNEITKMRRYLDVGIG